MLLFDAIAVMLDLFCFAVVEIEQIIREVRNCLYMQL